MLDLVFLDTLFLYLEWYPIDDYKKIYKIDVKKMAQWSVGSECSKNLRCLAPNVAENYVVSIRIQPF